MSPIIDPNNGDKIGTVLTATDADISAAVDAASSAFASWSRRPVTERVAIARAFAGALVDHREELCQLETHGAGKLIGEVRTEVDGLARHVHVMADLIEGGEFVARDPHQPARSRIVWEPYGVVAAVLPWNAPLNAAARRIGITIVTGNTVVLKPSMLGSVSPTRLVEIAEAAGVPKGVLNIVTGPGDIVGKRLVEDPRVGKVSFVGGTEAGTKVMSAAGASVVPIVAELGGKSPQIVFADTSQPAAVASVLRGFTRNAGQICTCGTRLLIERSIAGDFVEALRSLADQMVIGPGGSPESQMGPQISHQHRESIDGFVDRARRSGRRVATGGAAIDAPGFYYRPTVVLDVAPEDELFQEEVFGPVLAVTTFETEDEAVRLANGTAYGLVAGIWSEDTERALRVADRLDTGRCWINAYWASDPSLPSTPHRRSGVGAAETGSGALREFLRPKEITIA